MSRSAKNTAIMTMASVLQKVFSFIYFSLIARFIGVEDTGVYVLALSFTSIFVVFVDMGYTQILIREVAKNAKRLNSYLSYVLASKLVFAVGSYIAVLAVASSLGYGKETLILIAISGVTMIFDSYQLSIYGAFRALGNLRYEAMGIIGAQALTLAIGSYALITGKPLFVLMLAFLIPSILNGTFATVMLSRETGVLVRPSFTLSEMIRIGKISLPFALAGIFARVYSYVDAILLSKLTNAYSLGIYSIPYKITYAFQFVPMALVAVMYPAFSAHYAKNKERIAELLKQSFLYLLVVVTPIIIGLSIIGEHIIVDVYGEAFRASAAPLRILLIGLFWSYMSFPVGALLNACNKQHVQTTIVGAVMLVNITLNIILIPQLNVLGAAISALVGNILLVSIGYSVAKQVVPFTLRDYLGKYVLVILSGCVMGGLTYVLMGIMHYLGVIVVAGIVYLMMLWLTKILTKEHIIMLRTIFSRRKSPEGVIQ